MVDLTGFILVRAGKFNEFVPSDVSVFKIDSMSAVEKVERANEDEINCEMAFPFGL